MPKSKQKHKTIGVSFNPSLRQRALLRARKLGLCFSRYVSVCVEAELALSGGRMEAEVAGAEKSEALETATAGRANRAAAEGGTDSAGSTSGASGQSSRQRRIVSSSATIGEGFAVVRARRAVYLEQEKPLALSAVQQSRGVFGGHPQWPNPPFADWQMAERLRSDIALRLEGRQMQFSRDVLVGAVYADFLVEQRLPSAQPSARIALLCHSFDDASHAVLLGNALMLAQAQRVAAIFLCVPYTSGFEPEASAVFSRHDIAIVSPDTLPEALADAFARLV